MPLTPEHRAHLTFVAGTILGQTMAVRADDLEALLDEESQFYEHNRQLIQATLDFRRAIDRIVSGKEQR